MNEHFRSIRIQEYICDHQAQQFYVWLLSMDILIEGTNYMYFVSSLNNEDI